MTLEESLALNVRLRAENAVLNARVTRLTDMVERLTRQLDALLLRLGEVPPPKAAPSEEPAAGQPASSDADTGPSGSTSKEPPRRHAHGRGPKPPGLPVDPQIIGFAPYCKCGGARQRNGTVVTEAYHFVRAHVRIRRIIRALGRCGRCGRRITPPLPPLPFEKASCTFEMLAWVVYAKASLHLPLDRQRREFNLQGATISSAMITRWYMEGANLLRIVVQQLRVELLQDTHIRTDGTGIAVLDFSSTGQPAPIGHVTVFSNTRIVILHYSPDKKGVHAEEFLTLGHREDKTPILWQGTITADAESAHDRLFTDGLRVEGGCNAHGLRKFRDEQDKAPLLADEAMTFIGRFYKAEHEARNLELEGPDLLAHRQQHAGPAAVEFKAWLHAHREDLIPRNPVRKAIQYYLNHWDALTRFLEDPRVPLDNNFSEGILRKLVVGRKNWLFAGGEPGAVRVCDALSTIETCKAEGVDPYDYLCWVLPKLVVHEENRGLKPADLTPTAYKKGLARTKPEGFS